ncbi:1-acyl-sn-glycerol-3-phosphate acyltransferase [bacterium]|nr:1-acyl-sn-glycerol-3-phosphate acyltransferase [bacterium]
MKKFIAGARLILCCIVIVLYLIIVGIPVLTYCRIVSNPALALRLSKLLDRIVMSIAGTRIITEGSEKVDLKRGCVYVLNHRSLMDSLVAFYALPGDLRFLAKKELYKIPLVNFALRTMGMIEVDRSNPEAAANSIDRAVSHLQNGKSVAMFPEGTRNRGEGLLSFKKGAFVLAIKAQVPIVPVVLIGAEKSIAPDTIFLYPATIRMIFHDPIDTKGMDLEQRNELLEQTRHVMERNLASQRSS